MKQVLQDARSGEVQVAEVPAPRLLPGCVVVRIGASLVSAGTERASSEFASKNLMAKAKARPDLVREVINKIRRDGLFSAVSAVRSRLDQPSALGYSSAGTIIEVADDVADLSVGDRVACAGAGYAVHAEFACVPRLLTARISAHSAVSFEEAAFTTVGAVAMHGVRTADAKLGEVVAVIGLGLLGQLTVQILKAAGCRVLGMDLVPDRAELAARHGADGVSISASAFRELCQQHSAGHGIDAVVITAETASNDPVNLAAEVARERAVIAAVGTVGMELQRRLYYGKELDFRVSRSYGPGRYDAAYEQKGRDYPIGYVRWTETRNMEAFLQLLAERKLDVHALITHRFPVEHAADAYDLITGKTGEPSLGVLITYSEEAEARGYIELAPRAESATAKSKSLAIGVLGAGSFATSTLLPAIKKVGGVELVAICAANGSHARHAAEKFGFRYCATGEEKILTDPAVNTVVIATRHNLHARQVLAALASGKHVFCEKPLCLTEEELAEIVRSYSEDVPASPLLTVGFNRRFAPMAQKLKAFTGAILEPLSVQYRVNAGPLPPDHWLNDPEQGGGRILGEVCHFVDFLIFLTGSQPVEVHTRSLAMSPGENVAISLQFANGSLGTISYLANGDRSFSKERIEVFGGGAAAVLEDFRCLELVRHGRKQVIQSRLRQDKGHQGEWEALAQAVRKGETHIPFPEIVAATLATLRALESRSMGQSRPVDAAQFIHHHAAARSGRPGE
ncbi:MAG TPA: bi-domain-containing oxidoreductase [Terriglobales bacterium]|nr:bi-domain-containing oxidoreductase [Terriglobales bacterium]